MKKIFLTLMLATLVVGGALEARGGGHGGGGHGGGGRGGHGGYHGGGRGWGGRGWGGRGGWAGGWGWGGPALGVGLNIPVGGPSYVAPEPVYVQQPVVQVPASSTPVVENPYDRYRSLFNSDPIKNRTSYRRWLFDNYAPDQAQFWYNSFLTNYYNPYQASKPTASLSIGTGIGFGGGYYGRGWGGGWRR